MGYFIDSSRDIYFPFSLLCRSGRLQGQLMKSSPRAGRYSLSYLKTLEGCGCSPTQAPELRPGGLAGAFLLTAVHHPDDLWFMLLVDDSI